LKVKKFRIKPRLPVVGRILKGLLSTKKLDPQIESSLPLDIQSLSSQLIPVAFCQTWSSGELPSVVSNLLPVTHLEKSVAVTVAVATAGAQLEESISETLLKGEPIRSQVLTAIGEESADLAFQFISRLIQEEAQSDGCDLSEPVFLTQQEVLSDLFTELEAQTEGVFLDPAGHLSPRFTRVALLGWSPISKKKRTATLAHKRFA